MQRMQARRQMRGRRSGEPAGASRLRTAPEDERLALRVCLPILSVHAGCLLLPWAGFSAVALAVCLGLLFLRAFGLTAGYHRGLAHRSYAASRVFEFALACLGASAAQLGPLWWAAHHRAHHHYADSERDPHSPLSRGLWWAHMGWLLCRKHVEAPLELVPDLSRRPELRFLDRHPALLPIALAALLYALGELLAARAPGLGTSGFQLLVWGFFLSTTLLYHLTFAVNSLCHRFGSRPQLCADESCNNAWLGIVTLGDGWHNNHHRFPASARHGLRPFEIDATWLGLRLLEGLGLVWDLREPPARP
jgi:stearoyl-CoA desaturase (delta-9 desaturase)